MLQSEVRSFTEPGELAAAIPNAEVEISVAAPGPFAASITRICLHSLNMQRVWKNRQCVSHVAPERDRACITFHTESGPSVIRGGTEIAANNIAVIAAGESFFQRTVGPVCLGSMSLPLEELRAASITIAGHDLMPAVSHGVLTPSSGATTTLRKLHQAAVQLAKDAPEMLAHPQAARGLEQVLLQAMVACLRTDDVHEVKAGQRHHRKIMQRFHATLAADPDRPWYALEMAIAVGASLRSLSACCQEHLGMGPMRFLMLRRMQLARRELREADPGTTTVTDVATRYGFWQFGRFAGQYKLRFGESPSTTLYGRVGKVAEDHHGLGIASRSLTLAAGLIALALLSVGARAQTAMQGPAPTINVGDQDADSATALAKKLQNPIGDLYSFPFQNNANFNYGPHSGTQDILNVQPVIPIHINEDWNVITRTILPLIWQPSLQPAHTVPFGTGPTTFSAFLSPHQSDQRMAVGRRPGRPGADDQRQDPRFACLGRRSDWRAGLHEGADGCRRTGQQCVVVWRHLGAGRHKIQHVSDATIPELQFRRGMVCWQLAHHHRELAHAPATTHGRCQSARMWAGSSRSAASCR